MEAAAIGSVASAAGETTGKRFQDLGNEDFFALLIAQLQSQDPLNPTDNQQLVAQMSQIRQIEQSVTLNDTLGTLASEQRFGATSGLIGHYVAGTLQDHNGAPVVVQGVVVGVRYEPDGRAILDLHDGSVLPADKVSQVTLVENLPPEVLEQIDGQSAGNPDSVDAPAVPDPNAARARAPDGAPPPKSVFGDFFRRLGQDVDTTSVILDSILRPDRRPGV